MRYQLGEAMTNGEFSVEVEGLHPNGPDHKLKIFSMNDRDGDISFSDMGMSTMYRGVDGNPPNCIAFKAVFGSQNRIAEPVRSQRDAGIRSLDPSRTYFWKATWGSDFRLVVLDGGVNGNLDLRPRTFGRRNVARHAYAWLGSTQSVFGYRCRHVPRRDISKSVDRQQAAAVDARQRAGLNATMRLRPHGVDARACVGEDRLEQFVPLARTSPMRPPVFACCSAGPMKM